MIMDIKIAMIKEEKILNDYLKSRGLKQSAPRREVMLRFLSIERHVTADELYDEVARKDPSIGRATVYRTLKVLCECGLASELKLNDGLTRYEHKYRHDHHDHLVCNSCGGCIEVVDPRIEKLQRQMAESRGFIPEHHSMTIYGTCKGCAAREKK